MNFAKTAPLTIYFAGELFDHKHITGNVLLAQQLEKSYGAYYTCILPQDLEKEFDHLNAPLLIRNSDIHALISADLALFNFDGSELDSGTVVEFMIAKMLDIPSVILRTDLRNAGITQECRWNLMAYGYPRTAIVNSNCWYLYKKGIDSMPQEIAHLIHKSFQTVLKEPTIFESIDEIIKAYQRLPNICGSNLNSLLSDSYLLELARIKISKELYYQIQTKASYAQL